MRISRIDAMIKAQEGLESLTRRDIEGMQLAKLNALLTREKARAGFYKDLPERLNSLSELAELPFTTEADLADNSSGIFLGSQTSVERVISGSTSGTTGIAKRVFYTGNDLERTVQLYEAGIGEMAGPGDCVLICMPFSGPQGLGELISEAVRRLGARPVKGGTDYSYGEIAGFIEREEPDSIIAMPVPLLSMLRANGRGSLRKALVSADACPPSVQKACEEILGSRLFPHYGSREMGMAGAICCEAHEGMHLRENCVIAEIVDADGRRVPDGECGELVITTIGMEALPLIRYKTGDLARKLPGVCPCGSEVTRLEVYARLHDVDGMADLDDKMFRDPELVDFRAVRNADGSLRTEKKTLSDVRPEDRPFYTGKRRIL